MDAGRITKYFISGVVGITVNLGLYHVLVEYTRIHYLAGSVIAVSCSTVIGFVLQKYWTFEDRSHERAHTQFGLYVLVALINIGLNTLIVYVLAGSLGLYYLLAQAIAAAFVALWSFFAYREVIFKKEDIGSSAS